jgi:hypothetical protein
MLGEVEYLLITAAASLGEDAYGGAIPSPTSGFTSRELRAGAYLCPNGRCGGFGRGEITL